MAQDLERIQIKIEADASLAASSLDRLASALDSVSASTANNAGLTKISKALEKLSISAKSLDGTNLERTFSSIAKAAEPLSQLGKCLRY